MANNLLISLPKADGNPLMIRIFAGKIKNIDTSQLHYFEALAYTLVQDAQRNSKWNGKAMLGIYIGQSHQHARTMSLVLSLMLGCILPQFHITMDSSFATIQPPHSFAPPSWWQERCFFRGSNQPKSINESGTKLGLDIVSPTEPVLDIPAPDNETWLKFEAPAPNSALSPSEATIMSSPDITANPSQSSQPWCSMRVHCAPKCLTYETFAAMIEDHSNPITQLGNDIDLERELCCFLTYALASRKNKTKSNDTFYFHEALCKHNKADFVQAMLDEINDQQAVGHWVLMQKDSVPAGAHILPCI